jgi:hypothetical protein
MLSLGAAFAEGDRVWSVLSGMRGTVVAPTGGWAVMVRWDGLENPLAAPISALAPYREGQLLLARTAALGITVLPPPARRVARP